MLLVADNLNALNPVVARFLSDLEKPPLQELVRQLAASGVDYLDLNPGYLPARREEHWLQLLETVQEITELPLILDSPHPRLLAQALPHCRRPPILNALTLELPKLAEILPLAVAYQTDLVLLLLDEHSRPGPTLEDKLYLAIRLQEAAVSAGLPLAKLIFDPVLPNLSWPDAMPQTRACIAAIRLLSSGAVFGEPVRTICGLSNLRSGLRQLYPLDLELAALGLLAGAGLSLVLLDARQPRLLAQARLLSQLQPPPESFTMSGR